MTEFKGGRNHRNDGTRKMSLEKVLWENFEKIKVVGKGMLSCHICYYIPV